MEQASGLTIVQGSPTVLEDVRRAIKATEGALIAIISTLGQTRRSGSPWSAPTSPPRFMAEAISNTVTAAKEYNRPKLIIMSVWGAGDSYNSLNFLMRFVMNWSNMAQTLEDHNLVDNIVKESGLKFVLARTTMLKGDNISPIQDLGDKGENVTFMPSISSNAVAEFLLDTVEDDRWDGRTPVISS
jgi:NAD(P)H-binding